MTTPLTASAYDLPDVGSAVRVAQIPYVRLAASRAIGDTGQGRITVPATWDRLTDIIDPDNNIASLIKVAAGTTEQFAFLARHVTAPYDEPGKGPVVDIYGPDIGYKLHGLVIRPKDYASGPPTVEADWSYGANPNLLSNGDFEIDADPPYAWDTYGSVTDFATDTVTVHSGTRSARWKPTSGVAGADGIRPVDLIETSPGVEFTASAWVYHTEAGNWQFKVVLRDGIAGAWITDATFSIPTGTWTKITVTGTAIGDTVSMMVLSREAAVPAGSFYTDDAALQVGAAPASPGKIATDILTAVDTATGGGLAWLKYDSWSDTVDSTGAAWTATDLEVLVYRGQTIRQMLDNLAGYGYEWTVTWNSAAAKYELKIANSGNLGSTIAKTILPGRGALPSSGGTVDMPAANYVLAEGSGGLWDEAADTTISSIGRWERYSATTDAGGATAVAELAAAELAAAQNAVHGYRIALLPTDGQEPGIDFTVGDWITVDLPGIARGLYRLVAATVRADSEQPTWHLDLASRVTDPTNAAAEIIRRQNNTFTPTFPNAGSAVGGTLVNTNPGSADTTIPAVPSYVTPWTGTTYLDAEGRTKATIAVAWTEPKNTDGTTITDGGFYRIRWKPSTAGDYQYATVGWDTTTANLQDLSPGVTYNIAVEAVDIYGHASGFGTDQPVTAADTTPPSQPAAPTVAGTVLSIVVSHDLGKATGGTFNLENDLDHLNVYASTTSGFTPAESNRLGQIPANAANLNLGITVVGSFPFADTATRYVKVTAVDNAGNESPASPETSDAATLVDTPQIVDGAVDIAKFAAGITPVQIVSSLPGGAAEGDIAYLTTDNKLYRYDGSTWTAAVDTVDLVGTITADAVASGSTLPGTATAGDLFYLTTDKKLYRYDGSAWVATVDTSDLTGTITETQISDGAISTPKLQTNAVTAAKIAAGTITANEIAANTITSGEIAAGTITAAEIASGTITANEIASNTITAAEIAANTITAAEIAANTITAAEIAANTITAGQIAAGAISTDELAANAVTAAKIASGTITANEIASNTITAGNIAAGAVNTDELAANAVTAAKIAAGTITANEIAAGTITAAEIASGTITAAEIAAGTITLGKLVAGGGPNVIGDPSFEAANVFAGTGFAWFNSGDGRVDAWQYTNTDGATIEYGDTDALSIHTGSAVLRIAKNAPATAGTGTALHWTGGSDSPGIRVAEGDVLRVSLWFNNYNTTTGKLYVGVHWLNEAGAGISQTYIPGSGVAAFNGQPTSTWAQWAGAVTAPAGAVYGRMRILLATFSGTIYIDDVSFSTGADTSYIASLSADKITTGTLDADNVTVTGTLDAASLIVNGSRITAGTVGSSYIASTLTGKTMRANQGVTAYSWSADTDSGMRQDSAGQLYFLVNGVAQYYINTTRNLIANDLLNNYNNFYDIGESTKAFANVYSYSYPAVSDAAEKTDIAETALGLDFIRRLQGAQWRWVDTRDTAAWEAHNRKMEQLQSLQQSQLDAEGNETPESAATGRRLAELAAERANLRRPGRRLHHGLVAQQVIEALADAGVSTDDFAGVIVDPQGRHMLRYQEFLGPIVRAIQELDARVRLLES